jgi:hypothetical protein
VTLDPRTPLEVNLGDEEVYVADWIGELGLNASGITVEMSCSTSSAHSRRSTLQVCAGRSCGEPTSIEARTIRQLDPDDGFWTLLFHCIFDRKNVPARHAESLLLPSARTDGPLPSWADERLPQDRSAPANARSGAA